MGKYTRNRWLSSYVAMFYTHCCKPQGTVNLKH